MIHLRWRQNSRSWDFFKYEAMRNIRLIGVLCCALMAWSVSGQSRAEQLMARMQSAIAALGAYEAAFTVNIEGTELSGTLAVAGARYRIHMGTMEVYGDSLLRYEINHDRREVTLMPTERESTNLLSNPAHALSAVAAAEAALLMEKEGVAELLVQPPHEQGQIRLWLDTTSALPTKIRYEQEGIGVDIGIRSLKKMTTPLPTYDASKYAAYEQIDFR